MSINVDELRAVLESTGFPVAENQFRTPQKTPYIAFLEQGSTSVHADDKIYCTAARWRVELYTAIGERAPRKRLEAALNAAGIRWEREIIYNHEERYMLTAYDFNEME